MLANSLKDIQTKCNNVREGVERVAQNDIRKVIVSCRESESENAMLQTNLKEQIAGINPISSDSSVETPLTPPGDGSPPPSDSPTTSNTTASSPSPATAPTSGPAPEMASDNFQNPFDASTTPSANGGGTNWGTIAAVGIGGLVVGGIVVAATQDDDDKPSNASQQASTQDDEDVAETPETHSTTESEEPEVDQAELSCDPNDIECSFNPDAS